MPVASSQKPERHKRTKTSGIYYSVGASGCKMFEVRFTDATGKRRFETVGSFEQAKARLAEANGRTSKGEVVGNTTVTLADLLPGWRALREVSVKPRTRETEEGNVRLHIEPRWGRAKVRDISKNAITTWINGLARKDGKPMNCGTRSLVLAQLSSILDYAVDENILASNPCKTLSRKAKPKQVKYEYRVLADGELNLLLKGVSRRREWLAPIIRLTAFTGLRLGEVVGLEWGDVSFEDGTITVARQLGKDGRIGTPKGGVAATVEMAPQVRTILAELKLRAEAVLPTAPVFRNTYGERRQPRDVQRAFVQARDAAGLTGLRFHDLRHTYATHLARAGVNIAVIQKQLRHANLSTTLGYVHALDSLDTPEQLGAALAALGS